MSITLSINRCNTTYSNANILTKDKRTNTTTSSSSNTPVPPGNAMRGCVCPPCVQIPRGGAGNPLWLHWDAGFIARNTFYASFLGVEVSHA